MDWKRKEQIEEDKRWLAYQKKLENPEKPPVLYDGPATHEFTAIMALPEHPEGPDIFKSFTKDHWDAATAEALWFAITSLGRTHSAEAIAAEMRKATWPAYADIYTTQFVHDLVSAAGRGGERQSAIINAFHGDFVVFEQDGHIYGVSAEHTRPEIQEPVERACIICGYAVGENSIRHNGYSHSPSGPDDKFRSAYPLRNGSYHGPQWIHQACCALF